MDTQGMAIETSARTTPPIPRSVNTSKLFATIGVVANDNGEAERGLDHDGTSAGCRKRTGYRWAQIDREVAPCAPHR